jgi:excisionase family DNA binding protein
MNGCSNLKREEGLPLTGRAFFTRQEAAKVAGLSVSTLDRLVKAGEVPFKRVRRRVLFPKAEFIAWCASDQRWLGSMGVAA